MGYIKLLCLLGLHAAAAFYEWYGVVKLSHSSEYQLTIKTLDETMHLYIAEVNEGAALDAFALHTIVDGAEAYMYTYCSHTAADAAVIEVDADKKCVTLQMGTGATSTYELHIEEHAHRRRLSGDDVYVAIFAEHGSGRTRRPTSSSAARRRRAGRSSPAPTSSWSVSVKSTRATPTATAASRRLRVSWRRFHRRPDRRPHRWPECRLFLY